MGALVCVQLKSSSPLRSDLVSHLPGMMEKFREDNAVNRSLYIHLNYIAIAGKEYANQRFERDLGCCGEITTVLFVNLARGGSGCQTER